jgi:two-component system NtrC family sensor kinase
MATIAETEQHQASRPAGTRPGLAWWFAGPLIAFGLMVFVGLWALQFMAHEPPVPLIWPAAGIALAMTYRCGWPTAIGVGAGAFVLHLELGNPLVTAVTLGLLTGVAGVASAWVLRRFRFDARLGRVRDALLLLAVGGGLTAVLSAAGGTLFAAGFTPDFPHTFGLCWIADAMGMILLAPPLLAARMPEPKVWRELEAVAWIAVGAVFVYVVYAGGWSAPVALALSYAVFPLVIAVALRFGVAVTGLSVAAIAAAALGCTGIDKGPFAQSGMLANLLSLHAQLAMLGVTGLLFTSARLERDTAEQHARDHLRTLARAGRIDAMTSMAAGIAHEINQPLSAVNSYAHAAQRMLRGGQDPEEVAEALERVVRGNERAAAIVRRVRTFLRGGETERESTDINELVCEAIELVVPEYRRHRVGLTSQRAAGRLTADVDPVAIRQVIVNLLQNALDAVRGGSDAAPRWVQVVTQRADNGRCLEILVEDSGPGLPAERRDDLFEPLVTGRSDGTGLGLAIVRSLVEAHEGTVLPEDAPGGGARFRIRLPAGTHQREAA